MKITGKCIFITLEESIFMLNDSIKMKLIFQANIYLDKNNNAEIDFEIMDFDEITYWGNPVEIDFSRFTALLRELNVELNDLIDEQFHSFANAELKQKLITPFVANYLLEGLE